jgi:hypothetical protein
MLRDLGQPIMSHYDTQVIEPEEILDGRDRPKKPGEIEVDLTPMVEAIGSTVHSVKTSGSRAAHRVLDLLRARARRLKHA